MATVTATTWKSGYWDNAATGLFGQVDLIQSSLSDVFTDGGINSATDTYVSGWLYPSGSFTLYGSNLTNAAAAVSRITINSSSVSLDMQCNLCAGYYTDVVGTISKVSFTAYGASFTITGDMRISDYGNLYAFNTTEQSTFANGMSLKSLTNASGDCP